MDSATEQTVVEYVSQFMDGTPPPLGGKPWTKEEKEAAHRAADILNEARATLDWDGLRHCWIAIRLSDGGSDMVIYDERKDAVKHQLHEQQCAYIAFRNLIGGATWTEMLRVLRFHRMAYDAGFRLPDPDAPFGGQEILPSSMLIDRLQGRTRPQL